MNRAQNYICMWGGLASTCLMMALCSAGDDGDRRQVAIAQERPAKLAAKETPTSADAERKALAFIEEHQPKLRKLMEFLQAKQPASYQQALKELGCSQVRLEGLEKRDPELYKIELELWLIRSRLRLLAAEMSVANAKDQKDRTEELSSLIEQEATCNRQRMQLHRDRAAQQVVKLDEEIAKLNAGYDELIAKSLKAWQNKIKKQNSSQNKSK